MRWSLRLGSVRGIGIYVHATFLLIVLWAGWIAWSQAKTVSAVVENIIFILALFGCIVLHELGHALTALRYGIKTRDITLLPIGGLARLEQMPKKPLQELAVALAGPAVNVVIAAILAVGLFVTGSFERLTPEDMVNGPFFLRLMVVNIFLVLFNMLPAFPMDGGRALRALLATRMSPLQATRIAASVGQGMAFFFGFVGLFSNPFLVFIALFVWMGATQEAALAQAEALLGDVPVERAMLREFHVLRPDESLGDAVRYSLAGAQIDFPVVSDGEVVGVLTQSELIKGLSEHGRDSRVEDAMHTDFATAETSMTLEQAFRRLQTCQCRTLPVLRQGRLEGLITRDNIQAFIGIQTALAEARQSDDSTVAWKPDPTPSPRP